MYESSKHVEHSKQQCPAQPSLSQPPVVLSTEERANLGIIVWKRKEATRRLQRPQICAWKAKRNACLRVPWVPSLTRV